MSRASEHAARRAAAQDALHEVGKGKLEFAVRNFGLYADETTADLRVRHVYAIPEEGAEPGIKYDVFPSRLDPAEAVALGRWLLDTFGECDADLGVG